MKRRKEKPSRHFISLIWPTPNHSRGVIKVWLKRGKKEKKGWGKRGKKEEVLGLIPASTNPKLLQTKGDRRGV